MTGWNEVKCHLKFSSKFSYAHFTCQQKKLQEFIAAEYYITKQLIVTYGEFSSLTCVESLSYRGAEEPPKWI